MWLDEFGIHNQRKYAMGLMKKLFGDTKPALPRYPCLVVNCTPTERQIKMSEMDDDLNLYLEGKPVNFRDNSEIHYDFLIGKNNPDSIIGIRIRLLMEETQTLEHITPLPSWIQTDRNRFISVYFSRFKS